MPGIYALVRFFDAGLPTVWQLISAERTLSLLTNSALLAACVTISAVVIGVAAAYLTERTDLAGGKIWRIVLALPLAMPSYVAAYAWVSTRNDFAGFLPAYLILTLCTFPYVYLPVAAAFRRIDPRLAEVATTLGRGPVGAFWKGTWPQLRPAVAAGGLLVALYTLSDFGAVSLVRYNTFTRAIFTSYRASFDRTAAAVLAVLLMGLTLVLTVAEMRTRSRATALGSVRQVCALTCLRRMAFPVQIALVAIVGLAVVFPVTVVARWMLQGVGNVWPELWSALGSTVWIGALAALLITVCCYPIGLLAARSATRASRLLQHGVYLAHAMPGLVVALALVFFAVRLAPWAYQHMPVLLVGYLVLFAPLAVGAIRSALTLCPVQFSEVAASLGQRRWRRFRRVTLPLAGPGIGTGAVLVMVTVMKELPATLLLRPTGTETLATRLWTHTDDLDYAAAAPFALALVLCAVLPAGLLSLSLRSKARDADRSN